MKPLSRRTALKGLGVSIALPTLEVMGADASSRTEPPTRLCCIFQPNGVYPAAWNGSRLGRRPRLSPILDPLKPLLGKFSIVTGLENRAKGHTQMTGAFLTGVAIKDQKNAVSLDQHVAAAIGSKTPFPSIVLGTEPPRQGTAAGEPIAFANTVSWSSKVTRVSPEINPRVAFDRMFRDQSSSAARKSALSRKSVIDLALEDAKSLYRKVSDPDKQKLDEYLDSVRSVEKQVENVLNPKEREWIPPTKPKLERPNAGLRHDRNEHLKMMMDLMLLAFWTDSTRVGTLMTAHGFSRQNFSFLDGVSGDHHAVSHHKKKANSIEQYTKICIWYIEKLAYFLKRMDTVKENGRSLLDQSIVLYGSGMKDGNGHVRKDLPLIVAGKGGGKIRQGQLIKHDRPQPHSTLLLTIAQAMGLEMENFNETTHQTIDQLLI